MKIQDPDSGIQNKLFATNLEILNLTISNLFSYWQAFNLTNRPKDSKQRIFLNLD